MTYTKKSAGFAFVLGYCHTWDLWAVFRNMQALKDFQIPITLLIPKWPVWSSRITRITTAAAFRHILIKMEITVSLTFR